MTLTMKVDSGGGSGGIGKASDSSLVKAKDRGDEEEHCENLGGRLKT